MEKDQMLRARMTADQMKTLDNIVEELQREMPEANVSASSLARYALEKYINDYIAKRDKTRLLIDANVSNLCHDDVKTLHGYMGDLMERAKSDGKTSVANVLIDIDMPVTSLYIHSSRRTRKNG